MTRHTNWVREHSLSLILGSVAVLLTAHTLLTAGPYEWSMARQYSGIGWWESFSRLDYWSWWSWEYALSVVADVAGLLFIVLASKRFYEKDSPSAKDPPEERHSTRQGNSQ